MLFCQGGNLVWLLWWQSAWAAGQVSSTLSCWVPHNVSGILRTGAQGVDFLLWPVVWPSTSLISRHQNSVAPSVGSLVTHYRGGEEMVQGVKQV